jgi:protein translocase SecG subunit
LTDSIGVVVIIGGTNECKRGAETFFGKHKARSFEGKLQRLTKVAAAAFIIIALLLAIID